MRDHLAVAEDFAADEDAADVGADVCEFGDEDDPQQHADSAVGEVCTMGFRDQEGKGKAEHPYGVDESQQGGADASQGAVGFNGVAHFPDEGDDGHECDGEEGECREGGNGLSGVDAANVRSVAVQAPCFFDAEVAEQEEEPWVG